MSIDAINTNELLAPISADAPSGTDPRADPSPKSLYYRVKDSRNAARSAERSAVEIGGPPPEEWDDVVEAAIEVLANHAKDLEIATWLIEGLVRTRGFAGLRDGLLVLRGIVTEYWETCFPVIDEDGIEGKVSCVAGLSGSGAVGTLIQPIRLVPITQGSTDSYSLWSFEQANELEKITNEERKQQRIDKGAVTKADFLRSVSETPARYFVELTGTIKQCLEILAELDAAFDAVAGNDAPPLSGLRDLLQEIDGSVRHVAIDKIASVAVESVGADLMPDEETTAAVISGGAGPTGAAPRPTGSYSTREEALADLSRIALHFRRTEPHSPLSYTLDDAVRRARLPLPELLAELVGDSSQVKLILHAAGIKSSGEAPSESGS